MNPVIKKFNYGDHEITLETGRVARQAAGAVIASMDDTVVLESFDTRQWRGKRLIGIRYRFDFAQNGVLNHGGHVLIAPRQQALVVISTDQGQLIEVI